MHLLPVFQLFPHPVAAVFWLYMQLLWTAGGWQDALAEFLARLPVELLQGLLVLPDAEG
jgi:hypothetical protein